MTCTACGTATDSSYCPRCGAAVPAAAGAMPPPQPPNSGPGPGYVPGYGPGSGYGPVTAVAAPEIRNWVTGCHLAALAGLVIPLGNVVGPLVVWLLKKDESPLIDEAGKEALNFQISMTIYAFVSVLMIFVLIGIPLLLVVGLLDLIFTIVGAAKSSSGVQYRYPLTIRFLK
jgi:hypothetical protein